jgi:hypothetical protein
MITATVMAGITCHEDPGVKFEIKMVRGPNGVGYMWRVMVDGQQQGEGGGGCVWTVLRQCFQWYEAWRLRTPGRIRMTAEEWAQAVGGTEHAE